MCCDATNGVSAGMGPMPMVEDDVLQTMFDCLDEALASEPGAMAHYMSDIHGEAGAFDHLMCSASGEVRAFVERACGSVAEPAELDALCALLYYPEAARGCVPEGLAARAELVRRHCTGHFYLVGDVWDRGARGDDVMDVLMALPDASVQWGNHDICWMGAAAGDPVCIATCLRNNLKYGNTAQFEEGYDIDLEPLRVFAGKTYADDGVMTPVMKAISALLFKCEGQAVVRHPEWHMEDRLLWGSMNLDEGTVSVYGVPYPLKTVDFPTYDSADPFALSLEEQALMDGFVQAFCASERLQTHVQWLYDHGSVYAVADGVLAFHGCVPFENDGTLAQVDCGDTCRSGKDLLDWVDALVRRAWTVRDQDALDWMGYLWCGWQSTFAGRIVKTFERTYIVDEETWKEPEDPYYALTKTDAAPCATVLTAFGLDAHEGRIVNGHTPVKLPKGQVPVRGGGLRVVIDGGLCKAYRKSTGIAGYTLVRAADGAFRLVTHGEFPGLAAAVAGADMTHSAEAI